MDKETPTRLALQLKGLLAGLDAIGVERTHAWEIATKVALDSMPQARRAVIETLYAKPDSDTNEIADATGVPSTTARRTLEDLRAHDVVSLTLRGEDSALPLGPERRGAPHGDASLVFPKLLNTQRTTL